MRYFLDCEFNGFGGELMSLALVREDGECLYLVVPPGELDAMNITDWVRANVVPILFNVPNSNEALVRPRAEFGHEIAEFLKWDRHPVIVADWPDDIRYFCECVVTAPGIMAPIPQGFDFRMARVDAYPTKLNGAVQHNALWDAMALRDLLK